MKKGFTMIELIFVIVILGILAAIAVPKLTSVKADAEATKVLSNLDTFVNKELAVAYAANDKFPEFAANADLSKFTNVKGIKAINVGEYNFGVGGETKCITIKTNNAAGSITLEPNMTTTNGACKVAIIAAVKNGLLNGVIAKNDSSDGKIKVGDVESVDGETVIDLTGADSERYKTTGFVETTK